MQCGRCLGIWLTPAVLQAALAIRDLDAWVFNELRSDPSQGQSGIHCPDDGGELVGARVRKVDLDFCLDCQGIWFDGGELATVVSGLETRPIKPLPHAQARSRVDADDAADLTMEVVEAVIDFLTQ